MATLKAKSKAVAMVASGHTLAATGRAVGVSTTTVHSWVVASGITRRTKPRLSDDVKRSAVELVTAGLSIAQVSRRCGISWDSIARLVRQSQKELTRSVGKPVRCGCGALVNVVPCVACEARKQNETATSKNSHAGSVLPLSIGSMLRMYSAA